MTAHGHYEQSTLPGFEHLQCYVPEPSVRVLEVIMGRVFAAQLCPACRKPIGCTTAMHVNHRRYHSECLTGENRCP